MNERIFTFRKQLKSKLDPMRYEHSLSVSFTCAALAMCHGCDLEKAEVAGLLHDCAKRFTDNELIGRCEKKHIPLTEAEIQAPAVIHAKYGAWIAEHKFGIRDSEIISAIACHTTGKEDMSLLDKILYISDYIEPRRDKAKNLLQVRQMAFQDLDQTMYMILSGTIEYLEKKGHQVEPATIRAYAYFSERIKKREETEDGTVKRDGKTGN